MPRVLLLWLWCWSTVAFAQVADNPGYIAFKTDEGAQIRLLPTSVPRVVQLVVYGNQTDLRAQLEPRNGRYLADVDTVSVGEGTWFVTAYTRRDGLRPVLRERRGYTVLELAPPLVDTTPEETPATPSVNDLIDGTAVRRPRDREPRIAEFLPGAERTVGTHTRSFPIDLPKWGAEDMPGVPSTLRNPVMSTGPAAIRGFMKAATNTDRPIDQAVARYRLARAYMRAKQPREAITHLDTVTSLPPVWPADVIQLHLAQAHLQLGHWDIAREECATAWQNGADREPVLQCLAAVSRETGSPPPAPTARALLAATERPDAHLLAADLLLVDNEVDEAHALLTTIQPTSQPDPGLYYALLGDARFLLGQDEAADDAWYRVGWRNRVFPVIRARRELLGLVHMPARAWGTQLDHIGDRANPGADADADVRATLEYTSMLSRIQDVLGEPGASAETMDRLFDAYDGHWDITPLVQRRLALCEERLDHLTDIGADTATLVFFETCWRGELYEATDDAERIADMAERFARRGLVERALDLTTSLIAIQTRAEQDTHDATLTLARRYAAMDRFDDAYATLEYARTERIAPPGEIDLLTAAVLAEEHRFDEAEVALGRARNHRATSQKAALLGTWIQAARGDCSGVIDRLAQLAAADPYPDLLSADRLHVAHLRCLVQTERYEDAIDTASPLLSGSDDAAISQEVQWLASVAAHRAGRDADTVADAATPWDAVLQDDEKQRDFDSRLDARR